MSELSTDQMLALAYTPPSRREALRALWQLDSVLGAAAFNGREPMIRRIKLAWWREALQQLDSRSPPPEPTLEAVTRHILPSGVTGSDLSELEMGWAQISDDPAAADLGGYASERGGQLFSLAGRLLGEEWLPLEAAGEAWALVDLARRGVPADLSRVSGLLPNERWPKALRPLGMLAVAAEYDAGRGIGGQFGPARFARMIRHRLTGR